MQLRPVIGGAVALLVTFAALWRVWLGFFTSLFGLMLAAVIAHGVGTAVAMVVDLSPSTRNLRQVSWRAGVAAMCALFLWFAIPATYRAIIFSSLPVYREYSGLEAILSAAIAFAVCAVVARRFEPVWARYGGPLALVAVVVTSIIVIVLTSNTVPPQPGASRGGANQLPPGGPNMPSPIPGPSR
jgi:hypothetical protein